MQERYEKKTHEETNLRFCRLNRFFSTTVSPRQICLNSSFDALGENGPIVHEWCSHILSLKDENEIDAALKSFNQLMSPLVISYPASIQRDFHYYDIELHATERLAEKLEMSDEFNKACIDSDTTNTRKPLSDFQQALFNKFKLVWIEKNQGVCCQQLVDSGIETALRNREIAQITGLFSKYINVPIVEAFYTQLSEAGLALTKEQIQQFAAQDIPIVNMLAQVKRMFSEIDRRQRQFDEDTSEFVELESILAKDQEQSSSSFSMK